MGSILLALLFNPNSLLAYLGLAVVAAVIYFTLGLPRLLKIVTDIRVWFAVASVLLVLAFAHSEKRADALEAKVEAAAAQAQAQDDGITVTEIRIQQQEGRRAQTRRIDDAIAAAPGGEAHDAALDAIAAERPTHHGTTDEPTADLPDPVPGPADDGLRKPVDGVVEP